MTLLRQTTTEWKEQILNEIERHVISEIYPMCVTHTLICLTHITTCQQRVSGQRRAEPEGTGL